MTDCSDQEQGAQAGRRGPAEDASWPFLTLLEELGIEIDPQLLQLALTHRSYAFENGGIPTNERLEFLGDAVLEVGVTEYLYNAYPAFAEGRMAKLRAAVVSTVSLGGVARSLQIGPRVLLGRGEELTGGHNKTHLLADTTEALLGAVTLSAGLVEGVRLVHHLFDPRIDEAVRSGAGTDWKTALQEMCAELHLDSPQYRIEGSGPDHDRRYLARAVVGGRERGGYVGHNKKEAELGAARLAIDERGAEHHIPVPDA
ncbi:MAG: ribonuclease III [Acidipropionibacterium jensenii]|uniref:ribonuclease III n=1 Tax=Acidipropionibacterium jensenii TaxID=1749 RepID=UPI002648FFF0|nr:ribonuclease III [Acidipropionibacterium jensenii]MDN6512394.1 ribonuclease III [Acidipropionibacterium jensenii]